MHHNEAYQIITSLLIVKAACNFFIDDVIIIRNCKCDKFAGGRINSVEAECVKGL